MEKFNGAFKDLATKMKLPTFFRGNTLILNNLFLVILTAVLLIALLLVIFLMPGKKKKSKYAAEKVVAPVENDGEVKTPAEESVAEESAEESIVEAAPAEVTPVEEAPAEEVAVEEAPVVEAVAEEAAAEPVEQVVEESAAAEPVEEPAQEEAALQEVVIETPIQEEVTEAPAEQPAQEETPVEEPVEEPSVEEAVPVEESVEETPAPAEQETTATDARPGKNGGKYEIVKKNGSFYFLLKANNGQLLLESSGYTTEQGAKKAIETFKNAVESGEFNVDEDKNGNYKFILRASARSQMLYHGETYGTRQSAENAIGSVKNFAFRAVIRRAEELDVDDGGDVSAIVETKPLKESDHKIGGKYEIVERNGSFFFLLKANNGQLLLESPAYTTEQGAKNGIESFKKAADSGIYTIDKDKNGNFRFILRASTRTQLRYFGESYSTRQSAENSVNSVRAFAQKAVLK